MVPIAPKLAELGAVCGPKIGIGLTKKLLVSLPAGTRVQPAGAADVHIQPATIWSGGLSASNPPLTMRFAAAGHDPPTTPSTHSVIARMRACRRAFECLSILASFPCLAVICQIPPC